MRNKYTEQLRTIIYGAAVGDALGVPFEFLQRDSFTCDSMTTGGVHNVARGTFSDDTSMLLATCDSIKQTSTINPDDMRNRFCDWLFKGTYTADGAAFDVGMPPPQRFIADTGAITNTPTAMDHSCV